MLSTVNSVREYTGYEVTLELIKRAQGVIEIYIGKDEVDIDNPSDLLLLDKMVSYQTAYMLENEDLVFKQMASTSSGFNETSIEFDLKMHAPFIAPLAVLASKGLSFKKARSISTGKIFQFPKITKWRNV